MWTIMSLQVMTFTLVEQEKVVNIKQPVVAALEILAQAIGSDYTLYTRYFFQSSVICLCSFFHKNQESIEYTVLNTPWCTCNCEKKHFSFFCLSTMQKKIHLLFSLSCLVIGCQNEVKLWGHQMTNDSWLCLPSLYITLSTLPLHTKGLKNTTCLEMT